MRRKAFKRVLAALVIVVLVALLGVALRASLLPTHLQASVIDFDVGVVRPAETIEKKVTIANPTKSVLTVKGMRADCACIKKSIDRQRLAPGEDAEATFSFGSSLTPGKFSHSVTILFEETRVPITVNVRGKVVGWIKRIEGELRFGEVVAGTVDRCSVDIEVDEPWPQDDLAFDANDPNLDIRIATVGGDRKHLTVTADYRTSPETRLGSQLGEVVLRWKGRPDRSIKLPWSAVVVSSTSLFPRVANFGVLERGTIGHFKVLWKERGVAGRVSAKDLIVSHDFGEALQVTVDDAEDEAISVTMALSEAGLENRGIVEGFACIAVRDCPTRARIPILAYVPDE